MKDNSYDIIGAAIEVHNNLGPGLLESCYEKALIHELKLRGHKTISQGRVPILYKGIDLSLNETNDSALRFDILVDDQIIIELKSVEKLKPVYFKQLKTYMRFMNVQIGLLFNFNVCNLMKEGFGRVVMGFDGEFGK
ncbi:MAG: GxxExxY protein [Bacteroidales bacterium]|nr:GxxExxY protein [Bacteroidales bacterium]